MGFFSSISSGISSVASKATKGIKSGVSKVAKGVKTGASKVAKGVKSGAQKAGFNKNFGRDFKKGFGMVGRALQVPEKFIAANDPLGKKMGAFGFLSPMTLAGSIATAPLSSVGFFEELAVDKKKQKKLRSGDMDTIIDTSLAPLGLIPLGGVGGSAVKGAAKSASKSVGKKIASGFAKGGAKKIAGGFVRGISKLF